MGVAHNAMKEYIGKRESVSQFQPEHHHPSDPKEEDIVSSLHEREWIKALQVGGLKSNVLLIYPGLVVVWSLA